MWYDNYEKFLRPENIANTSLFIPYRDFRLTWNTNWRPGYRNETPVTTSNGYPRYVAESFTHTLDFGWQFRRNTTFYITARNIFNGIQSGRRVSRTFRFPHAVPANGCNLDDGDSRDILTAGSVRSLPGSAGVPPASEGKMRTGQTLSRMAATGASDVVFLIAEQPRAPQVRVRC